MKFESTYDAEKAFAMCDRLSNGEPLRKICREVGVPKSTFHDWRGLHPELDEAYLLAKDEGYDAIAERLRCTARGKTEEQGGDSSGDVQRDKLIVDTDLKLLAKWDPKRYGDKLQLGGAEDLPPLQGMTEEQVRDRFNQLLAKAKGVSSDADGDAGEPVAG